MKHFAKFRCRGFIQRTLKNRLKRIQKLLLIKNAKSLLVFKSYLATVIVALCYLHLPAQAYQEEKIVLGTDADNKTYVGLWLQNIYLEAFKRLNVPVKLVVAPLKRLSYMMEIGQLDGEMARGPSFGLQHPELIQVEFNIMQIDFALYALKPVPNLKRIEDLPTHNFRVAYKQGVLACEDALKPIVSARHLISANDTRQSINMLAANRADVFCDTSSAVWNEEYSLKRSENRSILKLLPITNTVALKPYLLAKHRSLALRLATVLKKMEQDGSIEELRHTSIQSLQNSSVP
jgi:hypothetical protein